MPLIGFLRRRTRIRAASTTLIAIASATLAWSTPVRADQGGISFLLPGAMGSLAGALGPIGFVSERSVSDSLFSYGDLFPQATLKWNHGVHNTMMYGMTNRQEQQQHARVRA